MQWRRNHFSFGVQVRSMEEKQNNSHNKKKWVTYCAVKKLGVIKPQQLFRELLGIKLSGLIKGGNNVIDFF